MANFSMSTVAGARGGGYDTTSGGGNNGGVSDRASFGAAGDVSGFGLALKDDRIPFAAQIGTDDVSFAYSLRQSHTAGGASSLTGDVTGVLGFFGITPSDNDNAALSSKAVLTANSRNPKTDAEYAIDTVSKSASNSALKPFPVGDDRREDIDAEPNAHPYDIWAEGRISQFEAGSGKGGFGAIHLGADYLIRPEALFGLSVQGDWTTLDEQNTGGRTEGPGFLITPYLTALATIAFRHGIEV